MHCPVKCSRESASAYQPKQNNHNGNHQECVNETAHGVGSDQPQEPQYEQNYGDSVKHKDPF